MMGRSQYGDYGHHNQQNQTDRSQNSMKGHVEPPAQGNHRYKIQKHQIIESGILQQPMGHPKKTPKRDQYRQINVTVRGVAFFPNIGWQHADPHHDVGDDDQNCGEDGDKTGVGEDFA